MGDIVFEWDYKRSSPSSLSFKTFINGKEVSSFEFPSSNSFFSPQIVVFNLSAVVGRFVVKWMFEFYPEENPEIHARLFPEGDNLYLAIETKHGSITFEATDKIKRHYEDAVEAVKPFLKSS